MAYRRENPHVCIRSKVVIRRFNDYNTQLNVLWVIAARDGQKITKSCKLLIKLFFSLCRTLVLIADGGATNVTQQKLLTAMLTERASLCGS